MKSSAYHGLLVLDKPAGLTSRDVVTRAQGWFPRGTRLGHTGTLDPLATGVLVLCVGQATRLAEYVQDMRKTYVTTIDLGRRSATLDLDAPEIEQVAFDPPHPERATVEECLQSFVGEIEQVPPAYSAAKVQGRRAYALARGGEQVSLRPRRVHIYGIELLSYDYPLLKLQVHCGKGTYIRSLARDLGRRLGRAGLLTELRRTRVGPFEATAALQLNSDAETARGKLLPLAAAVSDLPRISLPSAELASLRQGKAVPLPESQPTSAEIRSDMGVYDERGRLFALCEVDHEQQLLRPQKVFADAD